MSAKGFSGKYYKSTFSPYVGVKFTDFSIIGDSSIMPQLSQNSLNNIIKATRINEIGLGLMGGICYVYVYKDFFVHIIAGGGIIYGQEKYKKDDKTYYKNNNFDFITDVKLNFGYNTLKTFIIAEARYDRQFYNTKENLLQNFYSQLILKIGHRF